MSNDYTLAFDIPNDDARKDYRGMYDDLCDELGADVVHRTIEENAGEMLKQVIESLYDNREQIAQEVEAAREAAEATGEVDTDA